MSADRMLLTAPAIRGEDLQVRYRGRLIIDVPLLEIPPGATYALLGASGAGKSTLLRVMGLLERPDRGVVKVDGDQVEANDLSARRRIAAVFQNPYLLRGTVADNVAYGLWLRGVPSAERSARVSAVLRRVGLEGWQERSALTLSGGEAQRVALARALVLEPSFLLLDEPLSFMDPLLKRALTVEFSTILSSANVTALYVTHDQDEAAVVADRIGVMREGRIVAEGDVDTILGLPADPWHAAFVDMEPSLRGRIVASSEGLAEIDCDGISIFATSELPTGSEVLLAVRPEDVTLWEAGATMPTGSARNRIECTVAEALPRGGSVRIVVRRGDVRLAASTSRAGAKEMGIVEGSPVLAVFKATAVRITPVSG